jgi:hypothetical protein
MLKASKRTGANHRKAEKKIRPGFCDKPPTSAPVESQRFKADTGWNLAKRNQSQNGVWVKTTTLRRRNELPDAQHSEKIPAWQHPSRTKGE